MANFWRNNPLVAVESSVVFSVNLAIFMFRTLKPKAVSALKRSVTKFVTAATYGFCRTHGRGAPHTWRPSKIVKKQTPQREICVRNTQCCA